MISIKQSAADWCYFKGQASPEDYYRRLAKLGYAGVEMVPPERWKAAKEAGLKLVNLSAPGMQKGLNRVENHAVLLPQIRELIRAAAENEIDHLILFSGSREGQPDDEGLKNTIVAGKDLAAEAEAAGVKLVLELLNSYDHKDYQADYAGYVFEFARAVSSPAVKVLYDIYHAHRMLRTVETAGGQDAARIVEETILGDILGNLGYIGHLHIAGSPKRNFPGEGQEIDYAPIVFAVHKAGYSGFWGQEFLPQGDPFEELRMARQLFDSFVSQGS